MRRLRFLLVLLLCAVLPLQGALAAAMPCHGLRHLAPQAHAGAGAEQLAASQHIAAALPVDASHHHAVPRHTADPHEAHAGHRTSEPPALQPSADHPAPPCASGDDHGSACLVCAACSVQSALTGFNAPPCSARITGESPRCRLPLSVPSRALDALERPPSFV